MSPRIYTSHNILNWPVNTHMTDGEILNYLHASARDQNGNDISSRIGIDRNNINPNKVGIYSLTLFVTDDDGYHDSKNIEVDVYDNGKTLNNNQSKKNKKHLLQALIAIVLIILLGFILKSCMDNSSKQKAVDQAQSSSIAKNQSSISSLSTQNSDLQNQIDSLKDAVNQYQNNGNTNQLSTQLDGIQSDLNNLKQSSNLNSDDSQTAQNLKATAQKIQQDPSNAKSLLNQFNENQTGNSIWDQIQSFWTNLTQSK